MFLQRQTLTLEDKTDEGWEENRRRNVLVQHAWICQTGSTFKRGALLDSSEV